MVCFVQEGPGEAAVAALGEATETPERLWTPAMRATTAEELAHLAAQAHAAQVIVTLHLPAIWTLDLLGGCDPRVLLVSSTALTIATVLCHRVRI